MFFFFHLLHFVLSTTTQDAFGRDPKKETEFWRESARDLLASNEMQDAIAKFTAENPDNLTDEQRAYKEFIRQMDEGENNTHNQQQ